MTDDHPQKRLSRVTDTARKDGTASAEGVKSSPKAAVIVADDDIVMQSILKYYLMKAGYAVLIASDGQEVLDQVTDDIGAVLLDLHMPVMDGITCLRKMRDEFPNISPIMITASDDVSDAVESMKYGAFDYLVKPVNPAELLALVEKSIINWIQGKRIQEMETELARARDREISVASRIQKTLLMGLPPENIRGLRLAPLSIPSQRVDGDFFDFVGVTENSVDIAVGDVMGKGIAAALLGAAIKGHLVRALNRLILSNPHRHLPEPAAVISCVHEEMIRELEEIESFVTLCYARIDLTARRIIYVDCGHMPTLHYRCEDRTLQFLEGKNAPLGLPDREPIQQVAVPFDSGDFFLFYSDGVTEARNREGELYGEERLMKFIVGHSSLTPEEMTAGIWKDVSRFAAAESFADDLTCLMAGIESLP